MSESTARTIKVLKYTDKSTHAVSVDALSYARYSTENQANSSTEDQHRRIRRATEYGDAESRLFPKAKLELKHEFKDDAISGFGTIGREGLNEALAKIRSGEAKIILVDDFKRFLRDMGSALDLYDFLQDYGAELISISDKFSSSEPGARLKFMNKAYASEEFLDGVSRDTRRGLNERRYEGFSDGHLWFGVGSKSTRMIHMKGKEKESHHDYFIIPHLAQTVLKIFECANDGLSTKAIARSLNEQGIPAPRRWDRKTGVLVESTPTVRWMDKTVWQILNNRAYLGVIERGKTRIIKRNDGTKKTLNMPQNEWVVIERPDLRIVPQDLWDSVKEKIRKYHVAKEHAGVGANKPFKYDGVTNKLLTGICKCYKCGTGFVMVSGKHGGRYGCPTYRKTGACDNSKTVSWRKLEGTIIEWLLSQFRNDEVFALIASKYNKLLHQRLSGESQELNAKLSQLVQVQTAIDNIIRSIEQGLSSQTLTSRLNELETQKQRLSEQVKYLEGLNQSQLLMTPLAIKKRFNELPTLLREKTANEANRVLKSLFRGKGEIVLTPRSKNGVEDYWAIGKLNVGRFLSISAKVNGEFSHGDTVDLEIPFELHVNSKEGFEVWDRAGI